MNPRPVNVHIVIVDDDADTRRLLEAFAATEGYAATSAGSGDEALSLVDAAPPDLILLDAVMPGIDGFETCRRIKQREGTAHIPVIFMTGLSDTEHVVQGLAAGGVDYVTKPLVLDELAARIRVHLGNARTARSAFSALDSVGTRLLSCDDAGRIDWATPRAQQLLDELDLPAVESLRDALRDLIATGVKSDATFTCGGEAFAVTQLGNSPGGDYLFKVARSGEGAEARLLQQAFGLTPREGDVLLWTARGKSNKDMSEILNISARTVNKHLEQIFLKVGVENRASAAAFATRVIMKSM